MLTPTNCITLVIAVIATACIIIAVVITNERCRKIGHHTRGTTAVITPNGNDKAIIKFTANSMERIMEVETSTKNPVTVHIFYDRNNPTDYIIWDSRNYDAAVIALITASVILNAILLKTLL